MEPSSTSYHVLARRYRPASFEDLVGQEGLVRVLSHALKTDRFPHALILTGTRGVGKTTTARLVAKALNCTSAPETRGDLMSPCGTCESCQAAASSQDLDIIEMDAASNTGVDDVRELIEAGRYRPMTCRFKVYIVDEVHMLSKSAFNALLKTLEEPPAHLKFIFATTEIHKVPETILSRCMRFDLRRIEEETLATYFTKILQKEKITPEDEAIRLIARAANGSARDGLSLLDQALHLTPGGLEVTSVREMLHLADRTQILDLFDTLVQGQTHAALEQFTRLYTKGTDPQECVKELLALTHDLTLMVSAPDFKRYETTPQEQARMAEVASSLNVPVLARFWQMLLKGVEEVRLSPIAHHACEMLLVRLCHVAALPTPQEILSKAPPSQAAAAPSQGALQGAPVSAPAPATTLVQASAEPAPLPQTLEDLATLIASKDMALAQHLRCDARPIHYAPGHFVFSPGPSAPRLLATQLRTRLEDWTATPWRIEMEDTGGAQTLSEVSQEAFQARLEEVKEDPLVKAALACLPGARIESLDGTPLNLQKGV